MAFCGIQDPDFYQKMRAADLHIHGGALASTELAAQIAWQRSAKIDGHLKATYGSYQALLHRLTNPIPGSLDDYLKIYHHVRDYLFTDLEDIRRVCFEGALQAFHNGTCLLEVRTSIKSGHFGDPKSRHIMEKIKFTPEEEFFAMIDGFEAAKKYCEQKFVVYLVITLRRSDSVARCMKVVEEAHKLRKIIQNKYGWDYIRGLDIAGHEFGTENKAKRLIGVFDHARKQGFKLTAHAGEDKNVGEGGILHCVQHLKVDRIGHGSALYLPTPMLSQEYLYSVRGVKKNVFIRMLQRGIPLETCFTSNIICQAQYTAGFAGRDKKNRPNPILKDITKPQHYPFEIFMALGDLVAPGKRPVSCVLSTDGIFSLSTSLAKEYSLAAKSFNLDRGEILALSLESIRHSFLTDVEKNRVIKDLWAPYASLFLKKDAVSEANQKLKMLRQRLQKKLGISEAIKEKIKTEVADVKAYT
jgi:adenosine deaminase